jgi:hypothetical protein
MSINEVVHELCLFIFLRHTRGRRRGRQGEGSVYWDQQTDVIETKCNPTDININILSSPCNDRAAFPTHSSATTEKLCACNQQDFQRTNVYSRLKASTLINNITQPSLNNPKLPHKFQRRDNNHVQTPNIHRYKHIPLLIYLNLDPLLMTSNENTSMIFTRVH